MVEENLFLAKIILFILKQKNYLFFRNGFLQDFSPRYCLISGYCTFFMGIVLFLMGHAFKPWCRFWLELIFTIEITTFFLNQVKPQKIYLNAILNQLKMHFFRIRLSINICWITEFARKNSILAGFQF